ncbi:MAG: hypothetical protein ACR2LM_03310 [Pyrinomonadaceae bacterium]
MLLTLMGLAGGSVLPTISSSLFARSVTPRGSYAKSFAQPPAQATPDGRIVFKRVDINSQTQAGNGIYVMEANGSNLRRLASVGFEAALSPDGTKLAFVTGQPPFGCNNHELNLMPSIFGTDRRQLTNVCGYDQHPAWSPDGARFAFWSDRGPGEGLYVMNADGNLQTRILSTTSIQRQIESPHWSPDGTRIAFVGYNLSANEADIFVVNADGSNPVNITNTPTIHEVAPAWSRDNNKIAYIRVTSPDDSDIYTMSANGSNKTPLTTLSVTGLGIILGLGELRLAWSPDGTRLAFMDVGNSLDIFAVNADGSNRVNLTNTPDNDTYPDWQVAAPAPTTNPINNTEFFVRQHYIDFLDREPDPPGFAAWQDVINNCPPGDTTCDRIHVSSAFFRSPEFQERGYFVYRFYPVSFGRKPDYLEFIPDLAQVSGFLSPAELEAAKVAFINDFMARPAFANVYNPLNNSQYVDALLLSAGITHAARDFWIAALTNGTRTRAQVLREIADSTEVYNKYYNQAFVVMQYFGYLRRDPDVLYLDWIQVLNTTGDFRGMVNGFMNSLEYRFRFGP